MGLSITKRLIGSFAIVVVVTASMGAFGTIMMHSVSGDAKSTATEFLPAAQLVGEITGVLGGMRQNGQHYMVTGDDAAWSRYAEGRTTVLELLTKTEALVNSYEELAPIRPKITALRELAGACSAAMEQTRKNHAAMTEAIARTNHAGPNLAQHLASMFAQELNGDTSGKPREKATPVLEHLERAQRAITDVRIANFKAQAAIDPAPLSNSETCFSIAKAALDAVGAEPAYRTEVEELRGPLDEYHQGISVLRVQLPELKATMAHRTEVVERIGEVLAGLTKETMGNTRDRAEHTLAMARSSSTWLIIGSITGTLLGAGLAFFVSRGIRTSLVTIADILARGAQATASASGQLSGSAQSLAQGASEQAASLEESSSAIEEMVSMIRKNADTSQQANSFATEAKRAADAGAEAMSRMSNAIADIEHASQETAKIIKTIDAIAFQTNLLALNAAVEAARAGESGKGFAVVADEVRNLAMRSAEAARTTNSLIEESVSKAKNGVTIAQTVASNLTQINDATAKVSGLIAEIASAGKEQATGMEHISSAVTQMDQVTQTNAGNAEETAAASEELNAQAEQFQSCVRDLNTLVGVENQPTQGGTFARPQLRSSDSLARATSEPESQPRSMAA
jgi:methyl-accepting chemotaxis protein